MKPRAYRARLDVEDLGQRTTVQALGVEQLQQDLIVQRKLREGLIQRSKLLAARDARGRRGLQVDQRTYAQIEPHQPLTALTEIARELMSGDREHIGPETRFVSDALIALRTGQQRSLNEVV